MRVYKREELQTLVSQLQREGWAVMRRGAPTAFAWRPDTGEVAAIVLKPTPHRRLNRNQATLFTRLAQGNKLTTYLWTPQRGLVPYGPASREQGEQEGV